MDLKNIFMKNNDFMNMDYMVPAVTRDRSGMIPRPATNNQFLKIIREIMRENVKTGTMWTITERGSITTTVEAETAISKTTCASPRVWLPEFANKMNVPREERAFLGRWAEEAMADVYTREQRHKVTELWKKAQANKGVMQSMEPVPTDMDHEHYAEKDNRTTQDATGQKEETPKKRNKDTEEEKLHGKDGNEENEVRDQPTPKRWLAGEGEEWTMDKVRSMSSMRMIVDETQQLGRMPSDLLPERLGGPLTHKVRRNTKSNTSLKVHLVKKDMMALCGCNTSKYDTPTEVEIEAMAADPLNEYMVPCLKCFKFFTWPTKQQICERNYEEDNKSSSDVDTQTDTEVSESSNDTASEAEAVTLRVEMPENSEEAQE